MISKQEQLGSNHRLFGQEPGQNQESAPYVPYGASWFYEDRGVGKRSKPDPAATKWLIRWLIAWGNGDRLRTYSEKEMALEAARTITALEAEVHDLTGKIIRAEDVLGVIAQEGTNYPISTAMQYFDKRE